MPTYLSFQFLIDKGLKKLALIEIQKRTGKTRVANVELWCFDQSFGSVAVPGLQERKQDFAGQLKTFASDN
jgi:hypothetical protein